MEDEDDDGKARQLPVQTEVLTKKTSSETVVMQQRLETEDSEDVEDSKSSPKNVSAEGGDAQPGTCNVAPISIDEKPPAPSRQSWLLRLFESKMCDMHIAISYLFRYVSFIFITLHQISGRNRAVQNSVSRVSWGSDLV